MRTTRTPRQKVRTVPCPACDAQPGQCCQGRRGSREANHAERLELYLAQFDRRPTPSVATTPERATALAAMPYEEYLRTPEWRRRRTEAILRVGRRCQVCNSPGPLEVHHRSYDRRGHENAEDLTVLCRDCHGGFHSTRQLAGGNDMSYGAFVQACIDERRQKTIGSASWDYAAVKYANDNFSDYPEDKVVEALLGMRWPERPVTVAEVHKRLKATVSGQERARWIAALDGDAA